MTRLRFFSAQKGHGLSERWMQAADERVHIPMSGDVDSLNVAAASAVVCFALGTARHSPKP